MRVMAQKILFVLLGILLWGEVYAQTDSTHLLIINGIDYASTLQYEKAIKCFDKLITLQPDNPRGYFLKSAAYFWIFSTDMHDESVGDTLKEWSFKAVEVAEKCLDKNENDIDALFYLGGAYGTVGRYYGLKKNYLQAYWYGQKGKNILEEVVEKDSTYYDAYLGLGIYHYLADVLPRFVKILSFVLGVEGNKDKGIQELNLAATKGVYTKTEALFFLGAIYTYREEEYEKAVEIFNKLLEKYPDNSGALIHLGRCYASMGKCELALQTFIKILNSGNTKDRIPITSLHYQLGDTQFKMNDFYMAIGSYTVAVESDTFKEGKKRWTYPWALYKLGMCYEIVGKRDRAEYYYNLINEDDNERAYKLAQEYLKEPMQEFDISIIRNRHYSDCGKHEIALEAFQSLLEQVNQDSKPNKSNKILEIKYYIGKIKHDLGKYEEAKPYLMEVVNDSNSDESFLYWGHYLLGNCYTNLGQFEKALEEYDSAGETDDFSLMIKINKAIQSIKDK